MASLDRLYALASRVDGTYKVDVEGKTVTVKVTGHVTEDSADAIRELFAEQAKLQPRVGRDVGLGKGSDRLTVEDHAATADVLTGYFYPDAVKPTRKASKASKARKARKPAVASVNGTSN